MVIGEVDISHFLRVYVMDDERLAYFSLDIAAKTLMDHVVAGKSQEPRSNL